MIEEEKRRKQLLRGADLLTMLSNATAQEVFVEVEIVGEGKPILPLEAVVGRLANDGTHSRGSAMFFDEDHAMGTHVATVATEATIRPADPKIYYVYAIWVVPGSLAANRDFQPKATNGTVEHPMSTATSVASGTAASLWPIKEADSTFMTFPPFPCSHDYWIVVEDAMAAAETATIYSWYVQRSAELA